MNGKYKTEMRIDMVILYAQFLIHGSFDEMKTSFYKKHPDAQTPNMRTFKRNYARFQEQGSVNDRPRSGRPKIGDDVTKMAAKSHFLEKPRDSIRGSCETLLLSKSTLCDILKSIKMHPYKLVSTQTLLPKNIQTRVEFCNYILTILSSDEVCFFVWKVGSPGRSRFRFSHYTLISLGKEKYRTNQL